MTSMGTVQNATLFVQNRLSYTLNDKPTALQASQRYLRDDPVFSRIFLLFLFATSIFNLQVGCSVLNALPCSVAIAVAA